MPEVPPPKSWDHFVILVWQFKTNVVKDKALYESVNLTGFHIDRSNAALKQFADETKWPFYVDHAADKGYLHLGKNAGAVVKQKGIINRPNSLADPATIAKMKGFLKTNVEASKGSSGVAYALDDEVSLASFCTPAEVDGSPNSIAGYRKWLAQEYPDIDALNKQYGSSYKSFDEISPRSFETFRGALKPNAIGTLNLSMWCDWRSYMDTQFSEVIADLVRYTNTLDPSTPVGFVGGQGPNAWGGYDYRKLCKAAQWMEAYDIGSNNEILRSFWNQKHAHVQTYFSSKDAKKDAWFLWYYLVHGNRGVIAWPDGWFNNGEVAPYIKANAETYKEVQGPVSKLIIDGEFQHDPVAIYYSHPSIQVTWAMDAACHGGTWPNRSSSMDNGMATSMITRIGWVKALEDLGIQAKFVNVDHLLAGDLKKGGYKVLILNRALCLSDKEAEAIKDFAASGGTVIADHLCGIMDGHGKAREKGALDDFFGVKRDLSKGILSGDTLTEVDCEKDYHKLSNTNWTGANAPKHAGVAAFELGLAEDGGKAEAKAGAVPVAIKKDKAVYLNLSTVGFVLNRENGQAKEWLPFVQGLLKDAGVTPRLTVSQGDKPAEQVEPIFWKNGEKITLCLIRNISRSAKIDGFGDAGSVSEGGKAKIKLTFAKAVKGLKNERTGKELGDGASFEDEFTPWEANVYTYTP
ncbi:MAG: beta-galactosidase trimerization domain-containing protein [Planctomycetota bacterium]|nr:beta-galactosidase trimerization domain-containing protein [Planctomycetota bacterium]